MLKKTGKSDVQVISAGVSAMPGMAPTPETVEAMEEQGIDISGHIGQPVTRELVERADAIFCMEDFHREMILAQMPEVESKVHLLKTFRAGRVIPDPNIPDPIGRSMEVYRSCLVTIKEGVERIIHWLEGKE